MRYDYASRKSSTSLGEVQCLEAAKAETSSRGIHPIRKRMRLPFADRIDQRISPNDTRLNPGADSVGTWLCARYGEGAVLLRKFESLLDEHVTETGVTGLVKAAFGILAAGGVLYTAFGSFAVKAAGLTIAGLSTLGFLLMLLRSRQRMRTEAVRYRALLNHHCDLWYEQTEHRWRIDHWDEVVKVVSPNGDADVSVTVRALVEAQALPYFRVRLGSGRHWSPDWEQKRVNVTVRNVDDMGPRWEETTRWLPDGRLEVLVHFRGAPPRKGDELRLHFHAHWPGRVQPLLRGEPDTYLFKWGRPLALLNYRLELPTGSDVRYTPINLRPAVDAIETTAGRKNTVVELVARDIPAGRRIGMRLDLK